MPKKPLPPIKPRAHKELPPPAERTPRKRRKKRPPPVQCAYMMPGGEERCKSWAVVGKRYCRHHRRYEEQGGINAPNFKHGRYSKSIPKRLVQHYETARADDELLQLRDEIAVIDSRSQDLQSKLDTTESGKAWSILNDVFADFESALKNGDADGISANLQEIKRILRYGLGEHLQWDELMRLFRLRKELVESERKRLLELKQYITIERSMALVTALVAAVREEVLDPIALSNVAVKFSKILNRDVTNTIEEAIELREAEVLEAEIDLE